MTWPQVLDDIVKNHPEFPKGVQKDLANCAAYVRQLEERALCAVDEGLTALVKQA